MLMPARKSHLQEFTFRFKLYPSLLLALLFIAGIVPVYSHEKSLVAVYLLLWIASYPVIYAGTCRYCANYGKPCPVVLEGGMVHKFFKKGTGKFGKMALFWACFAYGMRIAVPFAVIIKYGLWNWGAVLGILFTGYWIFHIWITGCPNCINYDCLFNPGRD